MDKVEVQKDYYIWLKGISELGEKYSMLCDKLHRTPFVWIIDMDANRAADGKTLRYLYTCERNFDNEEREKAEEYLSGPCSLLEFLVALARRIEVDIMAEGGIDDRTGEWFWDMISNLGLLKFDDKHYNENQVDYILNRFMSRKYSENGDGNVFKNAKKGRVKGGPHFRDLEVWSQAQAYLVDKIGL